MLFCTRTWYFKVKTGISILNLTERGAIIDFKNGPALQSCKYRPVKCLWHWAPASNKFPAVVFSSAVRMQKNICGQIACPAVRKPSSGYFGGDFRPEKPFGHEKSAQPSARKPDRTAITENYAAIKRFRSKIAAIRWPAL